jgi:ferredoxin--NADP+ reductase
VDSLSYNATVTDVRQVHDDLLVMRLQPDFGRLAYLPGQYATLGLGSWEPHLDCDEPESVPRQWIRRAYSISHWPLDDAGNLRTCGDSDELEFYVALVRHAELVRPRLTPRLFRLTPGGRIYVSPHAHGSYTLSGLPADADVLFAGTGTGEAPHNAMIAELLAQQHRGRIASLVGVRFRCDLAYAAAHQRLAEMYANYRYVPLTTREPENLDPSHPQFVGKRYVQDVIGTAWLEQAIGFPLDPRHAHVFLCGNPEMIGLTSAAGGRPLESGAIGALRSLGFNLHDGDHAGNIHFERFF